MNRRVCAPASTSSDGRTLGDERLPQPFTWDVRWGSIPARFEWQARQSPDALAVTDRTQRLTYAQLNRRANRLAHGLLAAVGPEPAPVAILFELEADAVAAIYGVLKARKFYVPLDPQLPRQRLSRLLQDTGATQIIAGESCADLAAELANTDRRVIVMDRKSSGPEHDPTLRVDPDDLAYIMYTSGSTGEPKGVMQSHRNVLFDMWRQGRDLRSSADDIYGLLFAAWSSASCCSVFGALLNGSAVSCFDLRRQSVADLADWFEGDRITVCDINVGALRSCGASLDRRRQFRSMRLIAPGGEPVYRHDVDLCRRLFPEAVVQNSLGTTETRTATQYFIDRDTELTDAMVPIGYPVCGKHVLLVDDEMREAMEGEIVIRSRYLSPGYWKQPELTGRTFLPVGPDGETIYLTGDLGRRLADGRLLHLGRRDHQVKVRGYRVEIGEVESLLLGLPGVEDAAVVAERADVGGARLVAYLVSSICLDAKALRAACAATLPSYCVPAEFRRVPQLPKTPNGKLARGRVSTLGGEPLVERRPAPLPPRSELEWILGRVFGEVLGRSGVGIHDNFFEHGGDSLRALDCIALIENRLGVRLPHVLFVERATVAEIAALIAVEAATSEPGIVCLRAGTDEHRLYFLHGYHGSVSRLRGLARTLDSTYGVYGVEPLQTAPTCDMVALGAEYAHRLDAFQPRGTFRVAGHSFGGLLAYEVARQLQTRGRDVAFVGIIDSTPHDRAAGAATNPMLFLTNVVPYFLDEVQRRGHASFADRLRYSARRFAGRLAGGARRKGSEIRPEDFHEDRAAPEALRVTVAGYLVASFGYRPVPSGLNVVLFVARIRPLLHSLNPSRAWSRVAGQLSVYSLDGSHMTLFDVPNCDRLTTAFNSALKASGVSCVDDRGQRVNAIVSGA